MMELRDLDDSTIHDVQPTSDEQSTGRRAEAEGIILRNRISKRIISTQSIKKSFGGDAGGELPGDGE